MARDLKLDIASGKVRVAGAPSDSAPAEVRAKAVHALLDEIEAELPGLTERAESAPRAALHEIYQHQQALAAHPRNWVEDRGQRRTWSEQERTLDALQVQAVTALGEDGKSVWDDLPYVHQTLELYHAKQRAEDEVQRLILTPLGKLTHFQIDYQRQTADDLARVCQQVTEALRATTELDEQMLAWGPENRAAILHQRPLTSIPAGKAPSAGLAIPALAVGSLLIAGGGAALAGVVPGVSGAAGAAGLIGLAPVLYGALALKGAKARKAELPAEFAQTSSKFRERLYLVCALRTLNGFRSKLSIAVEAFRAHLQATGGQQRWKRVKFESRDTTELFATEGWDPRGTVELWLTEKIKETFRLDSTKMTGLDELDAEAWGVMLQAFELDALDLESSTEGRLLDTVSNLLFTKRGEDAVSERTEVFARVRAAWKASSLANRGATD